MKDINDYLERAAVRLKKTREVSGLTQKEFAEMFSTNHTTYCRYESGDIKKLPADLIGSICEKYDINPAWLSGFENVEKYKINEKANQKSKRLAILGTIAAGVPITSQEYIEGYEYVLEDSKADFCLRVKGNSMIGARIMDGDLVFIRQQQEVENGEIAAVSIDREEATLKRVYKADGKITLRSENPNNPDMVYTKKDGKIITILGKAILLKTEVR